MKLWCWKKLWLKNHEVEQIWWLEKDDDDDNDDGDNDDNNYDKTWHLSKNERRICVEYLERNWTQYQETHPFLKQNQNETEQNYQLFKIIAK